MVAIRRLRQNGHFVLNVPDTRFHADEGLQHSAVVFRGDGPPEGGDAVAVQGELDAVGIRQGGESFDGKRFNLRSLEQRCREIDPELWPDQRLPRSGPGAAGAVSLILIGDVLEAGEVGSGPLGVVLTCETVADKSLSVGLTDELILADLLTEGAVAHVELGLRLSELSPLLSCSAAACTAARPAAQARSGCPGRRPTSGGRRCS